MPMMELGFPVGATALKITANGRDYSILLDTATFDRAGEDGDIPILPLCRGCEFVGEVLPGEWKKGWTNTIDADQAFTAIIDSGLLKFKGEADVAGTYGYGWIKNIHPVPMMNNTEVTVELEVPINDVAAGNNRAIYFRFFLCQNKVVTERPSLNDNTIFIEINVTDNGLLMTVAKSIEDADDELFTGSTYDDASVRSETAEKFTVWRIVFHDGVAGADSPSDVRHMHVYLKQGVDRATAEDAIENELSSSPYDISDILFDVGYPAYQMSTQNVDYYDDGTEAVSTYFRVNYPSLFSLKYDFEDADVGKGDVELWDGDPDAAASVQVFDEDHVFTYDPYIQNGLVRVHIDEGVIETPCYYYWDGATWTLRTLNNQMILQTDVIACRYVFMKSIVSVSPEETAINVRVEDSDTQDAEFYVDYTITLRRGSYVFKHDIIDVFPLQDVWWRYRPTPQERFVYAGDDSIADDDIAVTSDNTTLTDNFGVLEDNAGDTSIVICFSNIKPDGTNKQFRAEGGGVFSIRQWSSGDVEGVLFYIAFVPFSLVANLFEEAEDGDYTGTTPGNDAAASPPAGNNYVLLNAIGNFQTPAGEYSTYQFDAGTHLPEGRYLAVIRARYVDEETMEMYVWNDDDDVYRNQENAKVTKTLAATFGYHSVVFDITAADVTGTDTFAIVAEKSTDDADEIRIDYMLVIPIGDGESWPQDLAHAAMRKFNKPKRLYVR